MTDITLKPIKSGYNLNKINDNFQEIESNINNTSIQSTGGNNVMSQDLDMNSKRILNLPFPLSGGEPLRKGDVTSDTTGATVQYVDNSIENTVPLNIINDPSQAYEFESVSTLKSSTTAFILGKKLKTTSFYGGWSTTAQGPVGGATYLVVTKATHDNVRGYSTVDEYGDHTLSNGNVALLVWGESINLFQFGAKGDDVQDDTLNIRATVDFAINAKGSPYRVHAPRPAVGYKLTDSIVIPAGIDFYGDSMARDGLDASDGTGFFLYVDSDKPAFIVDPNGLSGGLVGGGISNIYIQCDHGSVRGQGIYQKSSINATPNPTASTMFKHEQIEIRDCSIGISIEGVQYMYSLNLVRVVGVSISGIRVNTIDSEGGNTANLYSSMSNIEVTEVLDNAWAYQLQGNSINMSNLSCDGVSVIDVANGHLDNFTVEFITATPPPSTKVLQSTQLSSITNTIFVTVDGTKVDTLMEISAQHCSVDGVRVQGGSTLAYADKIVDLVGSSSGTLSRVFNEGDAVPQKLEEFVSAGAMERWVITDCKDITDVSNVHAPTVTTLDVTNKEKFQGNILVEEYILNTKDALLVGAARRADGGVSYWDIIGYNRDQKVQKLNTLNFSGVTPRSVRNEDALLTQWWSEGPTSANHYNIANESGVGVICFTGNTAWSAFSDENLKTELSDITDSRAVIENWRTMYGRYNWGKEGELRPFLIAQDVAKTLPNIVKSAAMEKDGEEFLTIEDAAVIPILVAEIKRLTKELDEVKSHLGT